MEPPKESESEIAPTTSEESVETVPPPSANKFCGRNPGYVTLVRRAINGLGQKRGSSVKSIFNYIMSHYTIPQRGKAKLAIIATLKRMLKDRLIHKTNGKYRISSRGRKLLRRKRKRRDVKGKKGRKGKKGKKGKKGNRRRKQT